MEHLDVKEREKERERPASLADPQTWLSKTAQKAESTLRNDRVSTTFVRGGKIAHNKEANELQLYQI